MLPASDVRESPAFTCETLPEWWCTPSLCCLHRGTWNSESVNITWCLKQMHFTRGLFVRCQRRVTRAWKTQCKSKNMNVNARASMQNWQHNNKSHTTETQSQWKSQTIDFSPCMWYLRNSFRESLHIQCKRWQNMILTSSTWFLKSAFFYGISKILDIMIH